MSAQTVGGLNPETSRMFRVRKTCLKMLNNRGYIVDEAAINMNTGSIFFFPIYVNIFLK